LARNQKTDLVIYIEPIDYPLSEGSITICIKKNRNFHKKMKEEGKVEDGKVMERASKLCFYYTVRSILIRML
tara:strand:- start:8 stop:223 length:216 start_codon:yes stop_codon:yes gene_type:complete